MKTVPLVIGIAFYLISPLYGQQHQQNGSTKASATCGEQKNALASGAYAQAALDHVWPPAFPPSAGITIAVQLKPERKVFLHTDRNKFELWVGTAEVPGNNVWNYLADLADICRLPPDPADAAKLLKFHWEVREIHQKQFKELHKNFIMALVAYVSMVQERSTAFMSTGAQGGGVDASIYPIVYDNSWEHFEIDEWNLPVNGQMTPMIRWVDELQKTTQATFHQSLAR